MKVQLVIFLVMIVLGLIQSAYRAYQKKKVQLDADKAERDRQQTILRTGRDPLAEEAAAMQRMEQQARREQAEIIAQRQEALRQLRRQQEEQQPEGVPPPPAPALGAPTRAGGGQLTRELWPGGPVIVIGTPEPARSAPPPPAPRAPLPTAPAPQPLPVQRAQPVIRPQQKQKKQQQRERAQPARVEDRHDESYYQRERTLARLRTPSDDRQAPPAAQPVFVRPATPQQWRAAFIAAEVFGTPVSMRDSAGAH